MTEASNTYHQQAQRTYRKLIIGCGLLAVLVNACFDILSILVTLVLALIFFSTVVMSLRRLELKTLMLAIAVLCIGMSIFISHWPLKVRFLLSKPTLDRAAKAALAGEPLEENQWYGLFRPWKITPRKNGAQVDFDSSFTRGAFTGVVYTPREEGPTSLNINGVIQLSENWYYVLGD